MKKSRILSLALAVIMLVACVPVMALTATAAAETTPSYLVYEQDFEDVTYGITDTELLGELGWYIPTAKLATNTATYKVVGNSTNKALRVDTLGSAADSFVSIFSGEVMSILSASNFTLKYSLTYLQETVEYDNYASIIYNYNEMHGSVANGEGNEVYGIAAVRACGTGFSAVYYPAYGAECDFHSLEKQPGYPNVMSNRYDAPSTQASLYALLGGEEDPNEVRTGTDAFVGKTLDIELVYDSSYGVTVSINGVRVSETNTSNEYNTQISNKMLWADFIARNTGATVALLAQPGIVADIDNISISTTNINSVDEEEELPALLITQISGYPKANWQEFIEIYNPNDFAVDVANYSLIKTHVAESGSAIDEINITDNAAGRKATYDSYVNLGTMFGKKISMTSTANAAKYITITEAAKLPETMYDRDDNFEYIQDGSSYVQLAEGQTGTHYKITYTDEWNTRYVRGSADYETNTMLNPGECMLLYLTGGTYLPSYTAGVNHGNMTSAIEKGGFRYEFRNYGLTEDVKVLHVQGSVGVGDLEHAMFLLGKAVDENNQEINYKGRQVTDLSDIESFVTYNPHIATGTVVETTDSTVTNFGQGATYQANFTASYVYGVDATVDYRMGTMYTALTPLFHKTRSHIGCLAGYQEIIIGQFYKKTNKTPDLMITEIMPHTTDLQGKSSNAFSAMELTNTSGKTINLYDYALTRTNTGLECTNGLGFNRAVELRAGNPVNKVAGNGSYYYFAQDSISNPESCMLSPGETVVIWFLTEDTYTSYYTDDDFGFSYFRQYWVNNGCAELAVKGTSGDYSVKVIAVDGCESEAYNGENALVAFRPSSTASAVYGVANASGTVLSGAIENSDVISIAYLGLCSTYYELNKTAVQTADGATTYYANIQSCSQIPVNTGMHYVAGAGFATGISAMVDSLKTNSHKDLNNKVYKTEEAAAALRLVMITNNALKPAGLGKLEGIEAYCNRDIIFRANDAKNPTTYRYFNEAKNGVSTLAGAALNPNSTSAYLRFDSSVEKGNYTALVATYGINNVKVGTLVMKSSDLKKDVALTKNDLSTAGIAYIDVKAELLYYTDDYAVLGATVLVNDKNYDTDYTAVSYLEVTTEDGVVHTYWSSTSTQRSVETVAKAAIKDTRLKQEGIYVNKIDGKYSPYTGTQIAQYKVFAGE